MACTFSAVGTLFLLPMISGHSHQALSVAAGYQVGSHLTVNNNSKVDRIGLRLTQKGPIAGIEASLLSERPFRPLA